MNRQPDTELDSATETMDPPSEYIRLQEVFASICNAEPTFTSPTSTSTTPFSASPHTRMPRSICWGAGTRDEFSPLVDEVIEVAMDFTTIPGDLYHGAATKQLVSINDE